MPPARLATDKPSIQTRGRGPSAIHHYGGFELLQCLVHETLKALHGSQHNPIVGAVWPKLQPTEQFLSGFV